MRVSSIKRQTEPASDFLKSFEEVRNMSKSTNFSRDMATVPFHMALNNDLNTPVTAMLSPIKLQDDLINLLSRKSPKSKLP